MRVALLSSFVAILAFAPSAAFADEDAPSAPLVPAAATVDPPAVSAAPAASAANAGAPSSSTASTLSTDAEPPLMAADRRLDADTTCGAPPRSTPAPVGRGVAFGMDNGLSGRAYAQGIRIRIPIVEHLAINVRGISTLGETGADLRWELGGRVDVIGHTPVYLNLVRLYGGGGPEIATQVSGPGEKKARLGGGGHFGFEFFLTPGVSFFAEIGGHSGSTHTAGGTVVAGMMLYPFTGP